MELTEQAKGILLLAARGSIQSLFGGSLPPIIDYSLNPELLKANTGAFVTLTEENSLRGCIGYLQSDMPLYQVVCDAAKQAAMNDPRFPPLKEEEIPHVTIEVSVLSEPFQVNSYEDIKLGEHGLILNDPPYRGLLLPQVATENNFTLGQFLSALCQKAGLSSYEWEKRPLNIKAFTAIVFSESGHRKKTYAAI